MKKWVIKTIVALLLLAGAFAVGRFSTPKKVKTVTQTITKLRTVKVEDKTKEMQLQQQVEALRQKLTKLNRSSHTVIHTVKKKDGTVTTTKTIDFKEAKATQTSTDVSIQSNLKALVQEIQAERQAETNLQLKSKAVTTERPRWTVSFMAGTSLANLKTGKWDFGGAVQYRLIGPLWVGGWGFSTGLFGVSLSLQL